MPETRERGKKRPVQTLGQTVAFLDGLERGYPLVITLWITSFHLKSKRCPEATWNEQGGAQKLNLLSGHETWVLWDVASSILLFPVSGHRSPWPKRCPGKSHASTEAVSKLGWHVAHVKSTFDRRTLLTWLETFDSRGSQGRCFSAFLSLYPSLSSFLPFLSFISFLIPSFLPLPLSLPFFFFVCFLTVFWF